MAYYPSCQSECTTIAQRVEAVSFPMMRTSCPIAVAFVHQAHRTRILTHMNTALAPVPFRDS